MQRFVERAAGPPPTGDRAALFAWGLAQPLLGLHMLRRHPELLRPTLLPIALVAIFCALSMTGDDNSSAAGMVARFYAALAGAASAPAFLFANTYARVAARAHERLGLGPAEPRVTRLIWRLRQLIRFAIVIALPIAPVLWLVGKLPLIGAAAAVAVSAAWTLHWIVVEAFDGARVAGSPGPAPPRWPWFLSWAGRPGFARIPAPVRGPLAWAAERVRRLTVPWHEEAALVAAHPAIAIGFGAAVAGLLAVPVVNLLFRPAVLIASVHVLGCIRGRSAPASEKRELP